jgi:hypothetical protein
MLCALTGCSGAGADLGTAQPGEPAREPTSTTIQVTARDDTLVEGFVSGRLPIENASECTELGFPITIHLTDAFSPDALVSETVTPVSSSACLYVQTIAAPADAWARVAYVAICGGGGDANLCGAQATRFCSVDVLLGWAGDRGPVAPARDEIFGFEYAVPRPDAAGQTALYRRALREVETLVTESKVVLAEHSAGSRHCAGENYDEIDANLAACLPLHERIVGILSGR